MDGLVLTLTVSDYIGIIGSLIGVIAVLFMRNVSIEIEQLRKDNEKLWEQVGKLRGILASTRENYVSKKDFDGAVNRIFMKLDLIDGKFLRLLESAKSGDKLAHDDHLWRQYHNQKQDE